MGVGTDTEKSTTNDRRVILPDRCLDDISCMHWVLDTRRRGVLFGHFSLHKWSIG